MTLLVARQCRLLGAAGPLRRLPAALTTRSYAHDASPELPSFIRKYPVKWIRDDVRASVSTTTDSSSSPKKQTSVSTATDSPSAPKKQTSGTGQRQQFLAPALQDYEIGSVSSAILVPASVASTVRAARPPTQRMLICADTRALRRQD
jgi:hypothetical protein